MGSGRRQRTPARDQSAPASASRACYGNDQPACNLRTYQVMVESFVDASDGSANYGCRLRPSRHNGDLQGIIDSPDRIKSPQRQRHLAHAGV